MERTIIRVVMFGLVSVFATAARGAAQAVSRIPEPGMTVRPRDMATATRTERAGEFELDSLPGSLVYVPRQCVGARRCPLVVFDFQGIEEGQRWGRPIADRYGMIILMPNRWLNPRATALGDVGQLQPGDLDAALKEALRKFAIDPDKIAIMGRCGSSGEGLYSGGGGADVFSRIALISGATPPIDTAHPPSKPTEFFVDAGLQEAGGNFAATRAMRQAGYQVKNVVGIRTHAHQAEDYDFFGHWLQESWAIPDPAARPDAGARSSSGLDPGGAR